MHHVFYPGFCFDTIDSLAVALVRCGAALAAVGRIESLSVPAVFDGELTQVHLLLGAGIPVAVAPFLGGRPVIEGVEQALARIDQLTETVSRLA